MRIFDILPNFPSPQVKWSLIISNKLVYTSCFSNCWTTQDFTRKVQNNVKTSWSYNLVPRFPPPQNFVDTSKRLLENKNWTFPVVRYFTWKLEFLSNILSVVVDLGVLAHTTKLVLRFSDFISKTDSFGYLR